MNAADFGTKDVRGISLRGDPEREPCFTVVHTDAELQDWPDMSEMSRRQRLHRHMNNEVVSMEIAAQCIVDFPDAPWDLRLSLARQVADESRHTEMLLRRLVALNGFKGEFPIANFEWSVTMMIPDLVGRLAVQNRTFEAGLIDILGELKTRWQEAGDGETAEMLETILADEIVHVRFANRWIRQTTRENPRRLLDVAHAIQFLARAFDQLSPSPGEVNAAGVVLTEALIAERRRAPAVNIGDRKIAEFTDDEVAEVLRQAGFRSLVAETTAQHGGD